MYSLLVMRRLLGCSELLGTFSKVLRMDLIKGIACQLKGKWRGREVKSFDAGDWHIENLHANLFEE